MRGEIWQLLDSRSVGGIESHVVTLAEGLQQAGERVRVLLLDDHGPHPMAAALGARGVPLETLGGGLPGLVRTLRRRKPAVVHTHGYKCNILGRLAAPLAPCPVVATMHSGEPGSGRLRLYLTADRLSSALAPTIAVSEPIARTLPGRPVTVGNFVAVPDGVATARSETIAFVGRLSHEKGPDLFAELARRMPEAGFVAYGDGPMRDALAGTPIDVRGMVADMAPHWPGVGLLCMPSRHEGLPMAALEAMARGIPVAAFAVGALPDLIADGVSGFLAAPGDVDGLEAAVRRWLALDGSQRAAMAAAAREVVRRRYDRRRAVRRIRAVYRLAGAA